MLSKYFYVLNLQYYPIHDLFNYLKLLQWRTPFNSRRTMAMQGKLRNFHNKYYFTSLLTHFKYCAHSQCSLVFIGFIQRWNNVVDYSNDTYMHIQVAVIHIERNRKLWIVNTFVTFWFGCMWFRLIETAIYY